MGSWEGFFQGLTACLCDNGMDGVEEKNGRFKKERP